MSSESKRAKEYTFKIGLSAPPGKPVIGTEETRWRLTLWDISPNRFEPVAVLAQGVEPTVAAARRAAFAARRRFGRLPEFEDVD
jgi:hypothetical protein